MNGEAVMVADGLRKCYGDLVPEQRMQKPHG